ncbi:MAG: FAD:protein FMN transferase, partial [Pseudomonadota bacterium]
HPLAAPVWSTVTVEAETATLADGFSTAFALSDRALIESLIGRHGIRRVTLIDFAGNLTTL